MLNADAYGCKTDRYIQIYLIQHYSCYHIYLNRSTPFSMMQKKLSQWVPSRIFRTCVRSVFRMNSIDWHEEITIEFL